MSLGVAATINDAIDQETAIFSGSDEITVGVFVTTFLNGKQMITYSDEKIGCTGRNCHGSC